MVVVVEVDVSMMLLMDDRLDELELLVNEMPEVQDRQVLLLLVLDDEVLDELVQLVIFELDELVYNIAYLDLPHITLDEDEVDEIVVLVLDEMVVEVLVKIDLLDDQPERIDSDEVDEVDDQLVLLVVLDLYDDLESLLSLIIQTEVTEFLQVLQEVLLQPVDEKPFILLLQMVPLQWLQVPQLIQVSLLLCKYLYNQIMIKTIYTHYKSLIASIIGLFIVY